MSQTEVTIKGEVNDHDWDLYKLVSEHYRQDLREFWSRSSLYILSQAFLFAAFATLVGQSGGRHLHVPAAMAQDTQQTPNSRTEGGASPPLRQVGIIKLVMVHRDQDFVSLPESA